MSSSLGISRKRAKLRIAAACRSDHSRMSSSYKVESPTRGSGNMRSQRGWPSAVLSHQPALLHRRLDEGGKQRVRRKWPRFELGVELHADEPGVVFVFDHLGQEPVGRHAAEAHAVLLEPALVAGIDLVAVAVALGNLGAAID